MVAWSGRAAFGKVAVPGGHGGRIPMTRTGGFSIADRAFASDGSVLVIGEVAQAHEGSLGIAHSFIDAIADAGCDAVKFQTHIASAESTLREPWRVKFSMQDETRFDYWRRMEFTEAQWSGLARHARDRGLLFLSSPFSDEAVELLERVGVPAWKIASGEVTNLPLLRRMAHGGLPALVSTGMSTLREIEAAIHVFRQAGSDVLVMQCTTAYPCPPERVGLNLLPDLHRRFGVEVGLSDHSGTIFPALAAATVGAAAVEVHVCFDRRMFGPDAVASVTVDELATLVSGIRFIEKMRSANVDKDQAVGEMEGLRAAFTKSLVARADLQAGTVITADHVASKKPGTGISPAHLGEVLGRTLVRAVRADEPFSESDLAPSDGHGSFET